jgi:hypothetical protein
MLGNYLIAVGAILCLLVGWIGVQQLTRWYSLRHPEFGPHREDGGGCGTGGCSHCKGGDVCSRA